jgi:hypothetical protein
MPITPALGRLCQEDPEFKISLGFRVRLSQKKKHPKVNYIFKRSNRGIKFSSEIYRFPTNVSSLSTATPSPHHQIVYTPQMSKCNDTLTNVRTQRARQC